MIRPRIKLELYKKLTKTSWETDAIEITDLVQIDETEGIETRKDTMSFKIPSRKYRTSGSYIYSAHKLYGQGNEEPISVGDKVILYAWNGAEPADLTSYLVMEAIITENNYVRDNKGVYFTFKGTNRTEIMLDTLVPALISDNSSNGRVDLAIKELFRIALRYNKNLAIKTVTNPDGSLAIDDTYIASTQSDGSAFPSITYVETYKTLFAHLEKLSNTKYTGDDAVGNYQFFVDQNQYLHWGPRSFTVGSTIIEEASMTSNLNKNTNEVINAIIVHGGNDVYGNGILKVAYNLESMAKVGSKWKYKPATQLANATKKLDRDGGVTNNGVSLGDNGFPPNYTMNGGSGWLMNFTVRDEAGNPTGNNYVTSDSEYNDAIRNQVSYDAKELGNNIINVYKNPRYSGTINLPYGSLQYQIGTLYYVQSKSRKWTGINVKLLRLVNVIHRFGSNGWFTSLELKEDEQTAEIDGDIE